MLVRYRNDADVVLSDDVEQPIGKALEQVASEIAINDWIGLRCLANALDSAFDLPLECLCRARAAFEVPEEGGSGLLLGLRVELDWKSHLLSSARKDPFAGLGPRNGADLAACDCGKPPPGFYNPLALHVSGRLAAAIEQPKCKLGSVLLRKLERLVEDLQGLTGH
jgi:hypothetical protein